MAVSAAAPCNFQTPATATALIPAARATLSSIRDARRGLFLPPLAVFPLRVATRTATRQPLCHTGRDSCHSVKFRPWLFSTAAGCRACRVLVQSADATECLLKSFRSTLGRNSLKKKKFIHLKKNLCICCLYLLAVQS